MDIYFHECEPETELSGFVEGLMTLLELFSGKFLPEEYDEIYFAVWQVMFSNTFSGNWFVDSRFWDIEEISDFRVFLAMVDRSSRTSVLYYVPQRGMLCFSSPMGYCFYREKPIVWLKFSGLDLHRRALWYLQMVGRCTIQTSANAPVSESTCCNRLS